MEGSYWFRDIPDKIRFPSLKNKIETDTLVIGGGIAGLSAAYFLVKSGIKTVLIEKNTIGSGDSGHTTAMLSRFLDSDAATKRAWGASDEAINIIEALAREEKIYCDFKRLDSVLYSKFKQPSFSKIYSGEAKFHARKYLLGLAEAVIRHGGLIFEESDAKEVTAKNVVVAVGLPHGFPEAAKLMTHYLTFVIGAEFFGHKPFEDCLFWDDEDPYHYFRWVGESELILGGEDLLAKNFKASVNPYNKLNDFLKNLTSEKYEILHKWRGSIFSTKDGLPYIGQHPKYYKNIYFATGFGGNGMTLGTIAGKIISDMIEGKGNKFSGTFSFNRL